MEREIWEAMEKISIKKSWFFWLLLAMVVVYFGLICFINLFAPPAFFDSDMYTDMRYAEEMWKHKSIFPEGWVFGNQLYAVSTPVVAGLFCGLTGNPVLAMGLASICMSALVLVSFSWMLRPVVPSREGRIAGIMVLLWIVLYFGDACHSTAGWQLLFTMCSYYACYALCAFLAFGCYLRRDSLHGRRYQGILLLTCLLSFGLGIQSLRQTAVMTLPLLGVEFLHILQKAIRREKTDCKSLVVTVLISASNLAGVVTARCLNVEQVEIFGETRITPASQIFSNLFQSAKMIRALVFNHDAVSILILVLLLLLCAGAVVGIVLHTKNTGSQKALTLFMLLLFGVLAIVAADVLTTMLVREIYYFMLFPLLAFLVAWIYPENGGWKQTALAVFLAGIFLASLVLRGPEAVNPILHRQENGADAVSEFMLENGYTTLYGAWSQGSEVPIASRWQISAGFWEDQEDPFVYIKYLCNPDIFYVDRDRCVYYFYGQQYADIAVQRAKAMGIEMQLIQAFPQWNIYLYTASENIMAAFG